MENFPDILVKACFPKTYIWGEIWPNCMPLRTRFSEGMEEMDGVSISPPHSPDDNPTSKHQHRYPTTNEMDTARIWASTIHIPIMISQCQTIQEYVFLHSTGRNHWPTTADSLFDDNNVTPILGGGQRNYIKIKFGCNHSLPRKQQPFVIRSNFHRCGTWESWIVDMETKGLVS